ncbi:energy transducer TonB [Nibricoccus aquaticus]|nr:TonB family protein [Nibricoccus aquaticus]
MKTFRLWILPALALAFATSPLPLPAQTPAETVYDLTVVDKAPAPKKRIKPDYPSSLKKRDTPAEITLRFIVTAEGTVTDINIVKFNDPDMVDPVYAAYEAAKFEPGQKAGKPVNTRMEITALFPEPKPAKKEKEKK